MGWRQQGCSGPVVRQLDMQGGQLRALGLGAGEIVGGRPSPGRPPPGQGSRKTQAPSLPASVLLPDLLGSEVRWPCSVYRLLPAHPPLAHWPWALTHRGRSTSRTWAHGDQQSLCLPCSRPGGWCVDRQTDRKTSVAAPHERAGSTRGRPVLALQAPQPGPPTPSPALGAGCWWGSRRAAGSLRSQAARWPLHKAVVGV